jgi:hypothetical protein
MVHVVPEPDTLAIEAPLTPPVFKVKSPADKLLTDAAKVAVYCTDTAFVNVLLTAVNELMVVLGEDTVLEGMLTSTVLAEVLVKTILPE